jgi:hypothetical protein
MPPNSTDVAERPACPAPSRTQRRWQVLYEQLRSDHEPCFQTDRRHACPERDCPWRAECAGMRAEWRR